MCELLGISSDSAVRPVNVLTSFYKRGELNPDGVGVAYYTPKGKAVVRKQAKPAMQSPLARAVLESRETVSEIFIAHVRLASRGLDVSYDNTHPFVNGIGGRDYIFAHNGSLLGSRRFPTGSYSPRGRTDSEYAFCCIASMISKDIKSWNGSSFELLHNMLKDINRDGTFNMMMSDGEHLFCYHDKRSHNGGLVYAERNISGKQNSVPGTNTSPAAEGYIISTNPLTDDIYRNIGQGVLKVFKEGKMVYSSADR